jgi:prepilin-type N-terminal cleavage/methylation domain-containing protein
MVMKKTDKKLAGFTLIELMIAMAVTLILLYAAVLAFRDASRTNQVVTLNADMADNLRASLNMITTDLQQAGSGIPTGGIPIPYTSNNSTTAPCSTAPALVRPKLGGTSTFPQCNSTLPSVEPGNAMGPLITAPDASAGVPSNPNSFTDEITVVYADNLGLDSMPINAASTPADPPTPANPGCPNGSLSLSGTTLTATFDGSTMNPTTGTYNCVNFVNQGITINVGDLIMFQNTNGTALLAVTAVSGQTLTFAKGDPFGLNGTGDTQGTINYIQTGGASCGGTNACFSNTTATRVWMVSYYLDNVTSPPYVRLIRQVGLGTATPVGETLENLQFTYNFIDGAGNPSGQATIPAGDSESQIMLVNVYLAARSTYAEMNNNGADPYGKRAGMFGRDNLMTQVSIRSNAYTNPY